MRAALRYLALIAGRTREPLPAIGACLFVAIGVYAYNENGIGSSYALTSVLSVGLAAWVAGAVTRGEPAAQAEITTVAAGGRTRIDVALVTATAVATTLLFVLYPLATGAFDRNPTAHELITSTVGHVTSALLGATIGVLFAPPRIRRTATAVAAVFAALIALIALPAGGPAAVARALDHDGSMIMPALSCIAGAALLTAAASAWTRRAA